MQWTAARMPGSSPDEAARVQTLMLLCPVCQSDAGDTLGVTGTLKESLTATVVLRCDECGTVYLSPAMPALGITPPQSPDSIMTRRRLRRMARGVAKNASVFQVDRNESFPETGSFDLILLNGSLETAECPRAQLRRARHLLAAGGRAIVIAGNAASSCFSVFGGRHWNGYQFPGTRQQLTPNALHRLCENSGLRVRHLATGFASDAWLRSTANWLRDWGAREALVGLFTGPWLLPQAMAAGLEAIAVGRGRGSLLVAELERRG